MMMVMMMMTIMTVMMMMMMIIIIIIIIIICNFNLGQLTVRALCLIKNNCLMHEKYGDRKIWYNMQRHLT